MPLAKPAALRDAGRMEHPGAPSPAEIERLAAAIEASWDGRTAYRGLTRAGNPAFGQCYPTSRVVQYFYPEFEIACGDVSTGAATECHFWNIRGSGDGAEWIDLSWKQFAPGSAVRGFKLLDRTQLGDSPATVERCELLLRRVRAHLAAGAHELLLAEVKGGGDASLA
jgi:hypothetical protein